MADGAPLVSPRVVVANSRRQVVICPRSVAMSDTCPVFGMSSASGDEIRCEPTSEKGKSMNFHNRAALRRVLAASVCAAFAIESDVGAAQLQANIPQHWVPGDRTAVAGLFRAMDAKHKTTNRRCREHACRHKLRGRRQSRHVAIGRKRCRRWRCGRLERTVLRPDHVEQRRNSVVRRFSDDRRKQCGRHGHQRQQRRSRFRAIRIHRVGVAQSYRSRWVQ